MSKAQIMRGVRVVGFMLVLIWAATATGVATFEHGQNHDLVEVIKRRSPVTDYTAAEFGHTDCRKNYEDAYLAAIGRAVTSPQGDPARAAAIATVSRYTDVLANIEANCPTPRPPEFSDNGTLTVPPYLPTTTTSTTLPR